MERVPDKEPPDSAFARQFAQGLDIVPPPFALKRIETLRRDTEFIADGKTDALHADIKCQYSLRSHITIVLGDYSRQNKRTGGHLGRRCAR
jgi:hypothetical protein